MRLVVFLVSMVNFSVQAGPCNSDQYRNFDFWLGEWRVESNGKLAGSSKISKILGGCVLLEEYETPTGFKGKSLNIFDKSSGKWHQTWTDNTGLLLKLEGEFLDGKMVLRGQTKQPDGVVKTHEIRWEKSAEHRVHQHWRTSLDLKLWKTEFYGEYSLKADAESKIQSVTSKEGQKPQY
ncbi:hypothetical protein A7985_03640 [Pseudoalteromonas luteoviolacea]|uniref:DUF1579 domain-containing protein n=1 Tax=Pseudoalteromonas luteoviolacea TaxID=43657 RepID=A0A1C0TUQ6_9GAMM|nr:hypothetical protein [Pseudoalteromonas luteoviolacea]OCQ23058.1 hypothetical protein A7985_03640 [Pseudoalteromonas luteoviolacea]